MNHEFTLARPGRFGVASASARCSCKLFALDRIGGDLDAFERQAREGFEAHVRESAEDEAERARLASMWRRLSPEEAKWSARTINAPRSNVGRAAPARGDEPFPVTELWGEGSRRVHPKGYRKLAPEAYGAQAPVITTPQEVS